MEKMNETNEDMDKKWSLWGTMKDYLPYLLLGVLLAFGLRVVISPSVVVGQSMEGSFQDGDYLLVYKLAYNKSQIPEYGDVVVLDSKEVEGDATFIKRVVGKPGDSLEFKDGELYRNGKLVDEPYALEKMQEVAANVIVPDGEVFLMGDNRNHSMDSRIFGSVGVEDEIIGKVITRLMPFDQSYKVEKPSE